MACKLASYMACDVGLTDSFACCIADANVVLPANYKCCSVASNVCNLVS